jgi:hypothetical protein
MKNAPGSWYPGLEARSEFLNTGRLMGINALDVSGRNEPQFWYAVAGLFGTEL